MNAILNSKIVVRVLRGAIPAEVNDAVGLRTDSDFVSIESVGDKLLRLSGGIAGGFGKVSSLTKLVGFKREPESWSSEVAFEAITGKII